MDKDILYKFPKDMLVHMLSTIQEKTIKECEKDHEDRTIELIKRICDIYGLDWHECKKCDIFQLRDNDYAIFTNRPGVTGFQMCEYCGDNFCSKHQNENIDLLDNHPCDSCLKKTHIGFVCKKCQVGNFFCPSCYNV